VKRDERPAEADELDRDDDGDDGLQDEGELERSLMFPDGILGSPDPNFAETAAAWDGVARNVENAERERIEESANKSRLLDSQLAEAEQRPTAEGRSRGAPGKFYSGESVERAVRQLRPFAKEPGRNKAAKNAHVSTRAIDTIIEHMKARRLRRADDVGWLVIRGELRATPKRIRMSDLETE
jgi:hypothetical protein